MQIPECPNNIHELDLMRLLESYSSGSSTWHNDGSPLGPRAKESCRTLYTSLSTYIGKVLVHLLDRVTIREMETFTLHDRMHGLKVAHLSWHILKNEVRSHLTPPEIALIILASHIHDLGMGLSKEERNNRLAPSSDLWKKVEIDLPTKRRFERLQREVGDESLPEWRRIESRRALIQAEEAILCLDVRERHAKKERYEEVFASLKRFHREDPSNIPDIEYLLSYDGDSFKEKLIDICVSHNEDASYLLIEDGAGRGRKKFPTKFPVGNCNANTHLVAATLRIADILEFDRERTPSILFHYFLPTQLPIDENRSLLEWGKHLAISNWEILQNEILFKGRCKNHIIHHSIVQFCDEIEKEIRATTSTFSNPDQNPFSLPTIVRADVFEEGYRYFPYKFQLDENYVFKTLMGEKIYDQPLAALREIIQNSVDACRLRDAMSQLYDPVVPNKTDRIKVEFHEPENEESFPKLIISDSGTGMDSDAIEKWFLKVGKSFYSTSEFFRIRNELRKKGIDFAPVSEFGIGFLSVFLLTDVAIVETSIWDTVRSNDTKKRTLVIDGVGRLIRVTEEENNGPGRFKGTRVSLFLKEKADRKGANKPTWARVKSYLKDVCADLEYDIQLVHFNGKDFSSEYLFRQEFSPNIPDEIETARIEISDDRDGIQGTIILVNPWSAKEYERTTTSDNPTLIVGTANAVGQHDYEYGNDRSALYRGGFRVGSVPGLPYSYVSESFKTTARITLGWKQSADATYLSTNLARTKISDSPYITNMVVKSWLSYLLDSHANIGPGILYRSNLRQDFQTMYWLEKYSALQIFELAKKEWFFYLKTIGAKEEGLRKWERGEGAPYYYRTGSSDFISSLLDLVLPRVCSIVVGIEGNLFINPPKKNYREILAQTYDFVRNPVSWGGFAKYVGKISELLYYEYPGCGFLNQMHAPLFNKFTSSQIDNIVSIFQAITSARYNKRAALISPDQANVLQEISGFAGHLFIGDKKLWRLDSFKVKE